jgi:hypothetical protein
MGPRSRTGLLLLVGVACGGCGSAPEPTAPTARAEPAAAAQPSEASAPLEAARPAAFDLRPRLAEFGLAPRSQGPRPTCSIFTTAAALEFAVACVRGRGEHVSVEHLNWAGNAATGRRDDGDFFHNALAGFAEYGFCFEASWPYAEHFDAAAEPSATTTAEAAVLQAEIAPHIEVVWIRPWAPDSLGIDEAQLEEIRRVIASGFPVAAGAAHSRLLVGYRDDAELPGGGVFTTVDSGSGGFGEVDYAFVRNQVGDAFWVRADVVAPLTER